MSIQSLLHTFDFRMPFPKRLASRFQHLAGLRRTRLGLARLDDHLLADIGLTRDQAETEASRSVWDAPLHWRG
ncbi:MAG: DUF1127 domain-containing protein [Rhodobacterales bacterium]|nr:DUF1127 domain-containing protein [Rhodobacterales bacterium]